MSDSSKWKSKLLSSSVPMEYEVAKMLVSANFSISSDYTYERKNDKDFLTDFSVDIHATSYLPNNEDFEAILELLVECKYRHGDNNKWLFFRDPNTEEMSTFILGHTIRKIDQFSRVFFAPNSTVDFDEQAICCIKGVEIDISNGSVHDSEIKHGLTQLQYSLPRLLTDSIYFNVLSHEEDNKPFLFCPILLTTSEIFVANENISIDTVKTASELKDIATLTEFIVFYLDVTPEFTRHRKLACSRLNDLLKKPTIQNIDTLRREQKEYEFLLPSKLCDRLIHSDEQLPQYFSQIIVCSFASFPKLIERIKEVTINAITNMKNSRIR